jgi:hypothetical protein
MRPFLLRCFALSCLASASTAPAFAAEPAIIAKARAFIASESALESLKSLHFTGTMVTTDPADPKKQVKVAMDIIFQHPHQQRILATTDKTIETTALDGYDGWGRLQDARNPERSRQTILPVDRIKRLRANTWENLAFYRGIEKVGGRIEEQGTAVIDGITCEKIAFIHAPNIIFYRFFDQATGRLVFTETESGDTIREQGEMIVKGIRFSRGIVTTAKNAKGEVQTSTITFEQVLVNEPVPAKLFAVPGYGAR